MSTKLIEFIMVPIHPKKKKREKKEMGELLYPKLEIFALFYCKQEAYNENSMAAETEKRQYVKVSIMVHFCN